MFRLFVGRAQVARRAQVVGRALCAGLILLLTTIARAQSPAPAAASEGSAPQASSTPADDTRLWVEPAVDEPGSYVRIHVRYDEEHPANQPVLFECEVLTEEPWDKVIVHMHVRDEAGTSLGEGQNELALKPGVNLCQFSWTPQTLADGSYIARFEVSGPPGNTLLAANEALIRILSAARVQAQVEQASTAAAAFAAHLDQTAAQGPRSPYVASRAALAADYAPAARDAFAQGDWRQADAQARYVLSAVEAAKGLLAFGGGTPELTQPAEPADFSAVQVHDGAFWAADRPLFLFGASGKQDWQALLPRLARYGLNLVVIELTPADTLASETALADFRPALDAVLECAAAHHIAVVVNLDPRRLPKWALDRWPDIGRPGDERLQVDLTHPQARALVERHVDAAVSALSDKRGVVAVCLADKPAFRFGGEDVRKGFIASVQGAYPDRDAVNRAWGGRMADMNDIDIWWDYPRPAYQYDWQVYHLQLGTEYLLNLRAKAAERAPHLPFFIEYAADALDKGESRLGIDREALAPFFPIAGCEASQNAKGSYLSVDYPGQVLDYVLMRSIAPDQPVLNMADRLLIGHDHHLPYSFAYVHSILWDDAISGLNASAVRLDDPSAFALTAAESPLREPQTIEAFATACLDLNRLGPIVAAFQQAPAEVALLWSISSKVFKDGEPHLASLKTAFEGLSFFGYKVRLVTERQCAAGGLDSARVFVIPETPAVSDEAFRGLEHFVANGGIVIRLGNPMPYGVRGDARQDMISYTDRTILIRPHDVSTGYLHALDAAFDLGLLPATPRAVNANDYPLEGVKTRYVELDGVGYLYCLNLRNEPVTVHLFGGPRSGRDLIGARAVRFPESIPPLTPLLVRLDPPEQPAPEQELPVASLPDARGPSAEVLPVEPDTAKDHSKRH